jgi:16S rRNA (cytidine1402-2'-O)-methyltransferase
MPGRLMLCATPVGNLEDVTLRVLRALRECDVVFAEDTRVSQALLRRYDITKPVRSFHERVETRRVRGLTKLLAEGKTVAMITDAGTPGISDPGGELVRAARAAGAPVEVLPGASALLGAVVLSGFETGRFRFEGFPPRKPSARRTHVEAMRHETAAVVWYEAPTRVRDLLGAIAAAMPQRRVFVLREYTKRFEEHLSGVAADIVARLDATPRGEFVVVLDGAPASAEHADESARQRAADALDLLIRAGVRTRLAVDAVVAATDLPKNEVYALAQSIAGRALDGADRNRS